MFGRKSKYFHTGIGHSTSRDEVLAVEEALTFARENFKDEATFAIIHSDSILDQDKIAKALNAEIGKNWVGSTVDKQFNSESEYDEKATLSILLIRSDYVHFSVEVAENVRKDPREKAKKATLCAIKHMQSSKDLDSYVAFSKMKKSNYTDLVSQNQYFILSFVSSIENIKGKVTSGREVDYLEGILDVVGITVPVYGSGAGSDFDQWVKDETGNNFVFGNGKAYSNAGVIVFVVSDLPFGVDVLHGYDLSDKFATVTKVDDTGHEILELNGKEPISEYCKLLGITKKKFLADPSTYSLTRPFGVISLYGKTYVKEALPNPDNKTFHSTVKTGENTVVNIMKLNEKKLYNDFPNLVKEVSKKGDVGIMLVSSCCTRRFLMGDEVYEVEKRSQDVAKDVPYFGGFVFSELGGTKTSRPMVHGESVTILYLLDKLF